jgi:hypothetical protein
MQLLQHVPVGETAIVRDIETAPCTPQDQTIAVSPIAPRPDATFTLV